MRHLLHKTCFFILLFSSLAVTLSAQALPPIVPERAEQIGKLTNTAYLKNKVRLDSLRYYRERGRAEALALAVGYPIRGKTADGGYFELQGFDASGQLKYYITDNQGGAATISTDQVRPGGSLGTQLTGQGFTIAIWEGGRPRFTHVELQGKVMTVDFVDVSDHATHVTGTCVGRGVRAGARGMAYNASARSFDFNNDIAEMAGEAARGLLVSNHSYGLITGWNYNENLNRWEWWGNTAYSNSRDFKFGYYDSDARQVDEIVYNAPFYLPVKSAGNDRNDAFLGPHWVRNSAGVWVQSTEFRPADGGLSGYGCVSTLATAKNILTVGAVEELAGGYGEDTSPDEVVMSSFSSWGPTNDGRIKPDIVAKGVDVESSTSESDNDYSLLSGTSMATPMVSGSILLIQEHVRNLFPGSALRASAMKALLVHTADECGSAPGPDYRFGWGLMNTRKAVEFISNSDNRNWFRTRDSLNNGDLRSYTFSHDGQDGIRVTIAWTDVPAEVCPPPTSGNWNCAGYGSLVNDLDLRLVRVSDNTVYQPWRLDPANPGAPAGRGDNSRDNVEQVFSADVPPGEYAIVITHKGQLTGGKQLFSIMLSGIGSGSTDGGCEQARTIQCGQTINGRTSGSAQPVPSCGDTELGNAPGAWFRLIGTGAEITLTTCSTDSDFDTQLAVYTGACDELQCVAGNDDADDCPADDYLSTLSFFAQAGVPYLVYVTGYRDEIGAYALTAACEDTATDCEAPEGLEVTAVGHAYFQVDWAAVDGATAYQSRNKPISNTNWTEGGEFATPGVIWGNRLPKTVYELQARAKCGNDWSEWSPSIYISTLGESNPYCISYGISWNYWIDRIQFSNLDLVTEVDYGYGDYTGETTASASVEAGQTYPLVLTPKKRANFNDTTVYWRVWVDWDRNNSFNDNTERVYTQSLTSSQTASTNISIPTTAAPGQYRLRISMRVGTVAPIPCMTGNQMETEDYTLVVTSPVQAPAAAFTASQTSITAGQQVTFTDQSTNAPTFWNWSFPGGTPATSTQQHPSVTYTNPGTYNVTLVAGNSAGSDTETRTGYIIVSPLVLPPAAGFTTSTVCGQAPLTVSFTDNSTNTPTSWQWDFGDGQTSTTRNPTVTYSTPGMYSVQLTAGNAGGSDTEILNGHIVVVAPITLSTPSGVTACQGAPLTLTATGADSYSWTGAGLNTTSGATVTANPAQAGAYTYQVVGTSNGCAAEPASVTLTFRVPPQVNISTTATKVCLGESVTLTASGATGYTWTGPGLNTTTGAAVQASPAQAGIYTYQVVGTEGDCSSSPRTVSVEFVAKPVVQLSAGASKICLGESVVLTATGATTYAWQGPGLSAASGSVVSAQPTSPGLHIYTVTGSSNGCNAAPVIVSVEVEPAPVLSLSAARTSACVGESIILQAQGAQSYTWTGPGLDQFGGATVMAAPTQAGTYTYQVIGSNGLCNSAPRTMTLQFHALPQVTASAGADQLCAGQSVTLTAAGATTYRWEGPGLTASGGATVTARPTDAGPQVYTVIGTSNGCEGPPVTLTVHVVSTPVLRAEASASPLCLGDTLTLTASGADQYFWNGPGLLAVSGAAVRALPTQTGELVYQLSGSLGACAAEPISLAVVVEHHPLSVTIQRQNCSADSIVFTSEIINGGAAPNVLWYRNGHPVWRGESYLLHNPENGDEVYCEVTVVDGPLCTVPTMIRSETVLIDCVTATQDIRQLSAATLFPNPNQGRFRLRLQAREAFTGQLSVLNGLGQTVHMQPLTLSPGDHYLPLALPRAAPGLYYVVLQSGEGLRVLKFVVY